VTAAGHGSKMYPRAAGHMQFAQLPLWEEVPANLACLSNASVTSLEVIQDVAALMVSWFDQELMRAKSKDSSAPWEEAAALLGEE
jgi:hypothetical protein